MKTLYEWLKETDKKGLIELYLARHPVEFCKHRDMDLTVDEMMTNGERQLDEFITELLSFDPINSSEMVFFATEGYWPSNGYPTIQVNLVSTKELDHDSLATYGWDTEDRKYLLGYSVADTELTVNNILEVLVYILYEASFWGYTQKEFEEGLEDLSRRLEETDDSEDCTSYEPEEFLDLLLPGTKKDPRADELKKAVENAKEAFNRYCFERELSELRMLLA